MYIKCFQQNSNKGTYYLNPKYIVSLQECSVRPVDKTNGDNVLVIITANNDVYYSEFRDKKNMYEVINEISCYEEKLHGEEI